MDGGPRIEAPLDKYLRLNAKDEGPHVVEVIFKGAMEEQHRWYEPLVGKVAFVGIEADAAAELPEDNRKSIQFIGDSITEGVLTDDKYRIQRYAEYARWNEQPNRPCQDDVTATYGWITAEALNLKPLWYAYGATSLSRPGPISSMPRSVEGYDWCYNGAPVENQEPDYVVINHGANDRGVPPEEYFKNYEELVNRIRERSPKAKVFALGAFVGAFAADFPAFVEAYKEKYGYEIVFIDTTGWLPADHPLHPTRWGHQTVADNLIPILRKYMD